MIETKKVAIKGMYCAACATRIEKTLLKVDGVKRIDINLATEQGRIVYDRNVVFFPDLLERVDRIGFKAVEMENDSGLLHADDQLKTLQRSFFFSLILTIPLALAMVTHFSWGELLYVPSLFLHPLFQLCLTIPIQFIIGFSFYKRAWQAIKNRSATMDVLVTLSTSAAFFYSHYVTMTSLRTNRVVDSSELFFETSAFIITFVLFGKMLEAKTKRKTTEAISRLYELQTNTANKLEHGLEKQISVQKVKKGDKLLVKSGEKIPLDGRVFHGYSTVNESLLTGESSPVEKKIGCDVYAGTVNQYGQLVITVTKRFDDTALSHIIRVVEEAQMEKAPIQKTVDKVTEIFVPTVMVLAIIAFILSYFYFVPNDEYEALKRLIAVLIIACPCALGLATPTSITVGSGRAAQAGILFKDGSYLEMLSKSTVVIFDKTGTLTKGEHVVTNLFVERGERASFLKVVGALERASSHPIAKAIMNEIKKEKLLVPFATNVVELPGYGVKGVVEKRNVVIASPHYFAKNNIIVPQKIIKMVQLLQREGKTVVLVSIDEQLVGMIAVADEVKRHAKGVVTKLKRNGIKVMMLSGDHPMIVQSVAKELGIDTFYAEVTPAEKARSVEMLQKKGHIVTMVGDGVNDAPALAKATIGISIGAGSDIAIDSSDIAIVSPHLYQLIEAMRISKKTIRNIKQNLLWAFLYNVIMIPFAIVGIVEPAFAGAAMAISSVTVVLNALRLKKGNIY